MRSVYDFATYRDFLDDWIASRPLGGKGERLRLARALKVHPSLITQILGGHKELTAEHAYLLGRHCGLQGKEREYLQELVQWERAGNAEYKAWLAARLQELRSKGRPQADGTGPAALSDHEKAIFYSAWYYSAIHLVTALPGHWDVARMAERFGLPHRTVQEVLDFLVSAGLCRSEKGQYRMGLQRTHIQEASTHLDRFLTNWRLRGIEKLPTSSRPQFFHSQQLCLSAADVERVRGLLAKIAEEVGQLMEDSTAETVCCLNIDWFET